MNAARVAKLHRDLAATHAALAEEYAAADPASGTMLRAEPVAAPRKRAPLAVVRPPGEGDELGRAAARRALRARGFLVRQP